MRCYSCSLGAVPPTKYVDVETDSYAPMPAGVSAPRTTKTISPVLYPREYVTDEGEDTSLLELDDEPPLEDSEDAEDSDLLDDLSGESSENQDQGQGQTSASPSRKWFWVGLGLGLGGVLLARLGAR